MTGEKPLKILHVDDEENQLEFTKLFLEQIDQDVIIDSVSTPEEALEKQKNENYDCVVSDYKMLTMNGIELAQKVREKSNIPFILYTGQGSEEVAELAFTAGIDDYLRKETEPTHYQILAKRIRNTVEKHRTDELYRKVVEESRDAIIILVDSKIAFMNNAACRLIGIEADDEWVGKNIHDLFMDEENKLFPPKLGKDVSYIVELNYRTLKGVMKTAEVSISPINYKGEEASLCFLRDITKRKRNEERLEALYQQAIKLGSSKTVNDVVETSLDIMETLFEYQIITFHLVEGIYLKTLGTRGAPTLKLSSPINGPGITAKAAREAQSILIPDMSKCNSFVKGTTQAKSVLAVPATLNKDTAAVLNIESSVVDDFTEDDRKLIETLAYHVAFAIDRIRSRELLEMEEKENKMMLNYALGVLDNAEKVSTLVRGDLQKSILGILNASGILRVRPEMLPKALDTIDDQAGKAHNISEVIRETIRKSVTSEDFIEVNQSIRAILEKSHFPKNIRINSQYEEGLVIVAIQDDQFTRIIQNLINNAVEAMPRGGSLTVKLTARRDHAYIDVIDSGYGIPKNQVDNIFKPFNSTKPGHSGLGLAFCKNAVESLGGSLTLKSTSEKGTTFRLMLPLEKIL
jgi:PAS domain S-box-containing protein